MKRTVLMRYAVIDISASSLSLLVADINGELTVQFTDRTERAAYERRPEQAAEPMRRAQPPAEPAMPQDREAEEPHRTALTERAAGW